MISLNFEGDKILVGDRLFTMPYLVREAFVLDDKIIVLLDPNSYLKDPNYGIERRRGKDTLKNLFALSEAGKLLWEAEMPEQADYYYKISSLSPLKVNSFSSYKCEIDPQTGKILSKEFFK